MSREDWDPRARHRPQGGLVLAGVLLLLVGAWQVFIGYAVAGGESFVFSDGGYWYRADNTAGWGWVNLVIGGTAILLGIGLVGAPRRLGRLRPTVALVLLVAVISAMSQFFLAPQFPLWSALVIAVDVFIIWSVTTQVAPRGDESGEGYDRIARLGVNRRIS